jgi:pimeloyl-ACP methyl ester carboxylesterase
MTTYVLIPGAGGEADYWQRLVPELQRRGHEAIAVALPAGDDKAGLPEYADVVVAAAGNRTDVVLVAQSIRQECDVREGRSPDAPFDPLVYFFHDVPEEITKEAMKSEPPQSGTPFDQPWPLDAWPDVPTQVLSSREDRIFPLDFQTRVAQERLGLTPETIPGGHLVALSRPVELADALQR